MSPLCVGSAWVGWQELLVHLIQHPHNIENNDPTSCQGTAGLPGVPVSGSSCEVKGAGPALMFQKFLPQGWALRRRHEMKGSETC